MLILVRHVGESIVIGDDIRIVIVGANPKQICLGIEAPKELPVHRSEIYERIQNEKKLNSDKGIEIDDGTYDFDDDEL